MSDIYIKHERHQDIAIRLTSPIKRTRTGYLITGKYVNQGFVETFEIGVPTTLTINAANLSQWLVCKNPDATCIRYAGWRPAVWTPLRKAV